MIDYEKKYLDALERANSFQEKYGGDYAGYIFPELRESEDERIRKFLVDYFASYKIGNVTTKLNGVRIDDILNYLEKQKEQKPAEWSEEDKEKLKAICTYLRDYSRLAKLGDKLRFNEYCDFLESLRPVSKESLQPHWKPSEEQMRALLKVVDKARELHYSSNSGYDEYDVLRSLYKQLKEL